MNVLVTGSSGQLGSEIRVLSKNYPSIKFQFTDVDEFDITNPTAIDGYLSRFKPDFLVNCAAYTAVDKAEQDSGTAYQINTFAPGLLALKCLVHDCKLIHISTDYVFDGNSNTPYKEDDRVNPESTYGRTKLEGERAVISSGCGMVIRTSWLYSVYGNNFVKTIIRNGMVKPELRVVNDQLGCPTWANDLAKVILTIIEKGKHAFLPEIFHYSNEGACTWYDFASEIVKLMNLDCKVIPIETQDYPTLAKRPQYSVFNKSKIRNLLNIEKIPNWQVSLARCTDQLKEMELN